MLAHLLLLGWDVQALLGWWEPGGPETLAPRAPLFFQLLHIEEAETAFFFFFFPERIMIKMLVLGRNQSDTISQIFKSVESP